MNWNPYKRIADLERRVDEMHHEMLHMVASISARVRKLEHKMGRSDVLADFKNHAAPSGLPTELLTLEQTQALLDKFDKRARVNAARRKAYAQRKRLEAKAMAMQGEQS
jgi:hypothetical protein